MRKKCEWSHERLTRYIIRSITSHNTYIDVFILAVLWPVRTESILRTSAVLPRDPVLIPVAIYIVYGRDCLVLTVLGIVQFCFIII
jgi:hypothetical protein